MAESELDKARDLIKQKRYQEARDLLQTIDHPEAIELTLTLESLELAESKGEKRQGYDSKFLETWVKAEQRLYEYLSYASLITAIYFIVVDPFQTRAGTSSPTSRSNAWLVIPVMLIVLAAFLWWHKGRETTIRNNLLRVQAGQYQFSAMDSTAWR